MTIDELILGLQLFKTLNGGDLPVYIDKNKYGIATDLVVWHCDKRDDELEHIHLKPVYNDED